MNPLFRIDFSISDSLKIVRKSVLIYETIIQSQVDTMRFGMEQEIERRLLRKMNTSVAVIFMNR